MEKSLTSNVCLLKPSLCDCYLYQAWDGVGTRLTVFLDPQCVRLSGGRLLDMAQVPGGDGTLNSTHQLLSLSWV